MPPKNREKLTREQILEKKRQAERRRYQRIKNDPAKLAQQKEKERLKYLKKKEKGIRKSVKDMTEREQRAIRKKWKKYSASYRENKRALQDITNNFVAQDTPPDSENEQTVRPRQNENRYLDAAKRRSTAQRKLRNKKIKEMNETIEKLQTKLLRYKKRYFRTKEKKPLMPKTKINKLIQ